MDPNIILSLISDLYTQVRQLAGELGQAKADIMARDKTIADLQAAIIDNPGPAADAG